MLARCTAAMTIAAVCAAVPAHADAVADFYKGKQINLIVGYGPGGGYDIYARLLARHFGRFVPGDPNVIVRNMPGAGSLRAVNYLYNVAPKDGSTIAMFSRNRSACLAEIPTSSSIRASSPGSAPPRASLTTPTF